MDDAPPSFHCVAGRPRRSALVAALSMTTGLTLCVWLSALHAEEEAVDLQPPTTATTPECDEALPAPLVVTPAASAGRATTVISPAQLDALQSTNETRIVPAPSALRRVFAAPPSPPDSVTDTEGESILVVEPQREEGGPAELPAPNFDGPSGTENAPCIDDSRLNSRRRTISIRPGDELWYISSRALAKVPWCDGPPPLRVWRHDACSGAKSPSSLMEFFAHDDPQVVTLIYVHGARVTEFRAFARLPLIYAALTRHLPCDVRVRMVMFSWTNPKTVRVLRDFRVASACAAPYGESLAWLASHVDPQVRVSLLSFSLGAQVVSRALDTLGGDENLHLRRRMRVVLWTAAESHEWMVPGGYHGRAIHSIDRLLLVLNTCDPVLKHFPLISPRTDPHALGYCGFDDLQAFGVDATRIHCINAASQLGVSHSYRRHLESPMVIAATRPYVFWQDVDAPCEQKSPAEMISSATR